MKAAYDDTFGDKELEDACPATAKASEYMTSPSKYSKLTVTKDAEVEGRGSRS